MGVVECKNLTRATCSTNPDGSEYIYVPELCDHKDNDCDRRYDEDFGWQDPINGWRIVGTWCEGIGECEMGVVECYNHTSYNPESGACSTNPDGTEYIFVPEVCDDKDNDCDSSVDEDFGWINQTGGWNMAGTTCDGIGECNIGVVECLNLTDGICSTTIWGSEYIYMPEIFDGKDNDCNSVIDNNISRVNFTGKVGLRTGANNSAFLNISLKYLENNYVFNINTSSNSNGNFLLEIPEGVYDMWVKPKNFLARLNYTITVPGEIFDFGNSRCADAVDDNKVNYHDLPIFSSCYGKNSSSLNWSSNCDLYDFNRDARVNYLDTAPFSYCYNQYGIGGQNFSF